MTGPACRVCPECGHENWGLRLMDTKGYVLYQLPPPKTCEICDALLVVTVRHVAQAQASLQGVS